MFRLSLGKDTALYIILVNISLPNSCMKGLAEPLRIAAIEACHSLFPTALSLTVSGYSRRMTLCGFGILDKFLMQN